jgi:hypothetical protein
VSDGRFFFSRLIEILKQSEIPLMVSGSIASSFLGDPRTTNDIDVIIDTDRAGLDRFIDSLPSDWYVSPAAAYDAMKNRSMFNIIDPAGGKADIMFRKDRAFSLGEFSRRREATILDTSVTMVTPEDSILSKLEWSKDSESQRHYRDALQVARLNGGMLDRDYLHKWAKELGISEKLSALLDEADRLRSNAGN